MTGQKSGVQAGEQHKEANLGQKEARDEKDKTADLKRMGEKGDQDKDR
jgi:hypothetical protein